MGYTPPEIAKLATVGLAGEASGEDGAEGGEVGADGHGAPEAAPAQQPTGAAAGGGVNLGVLRLNFPPVDLAEVGRLDFGLGVFRFPSKRKIAEARQAALGAPDAAAAAAASAPASGSA